MSRYPGTQFRVHDNSQATAIVPVRNINPNDTVQYLSAFASVKGPEGITLTYGEDFYTRYGTQDNIDFKKYGQPLLQASMNVNNGAAILAKRAVLDDATLGNVTLGVALTKYKDGNIEVNENDPERIKKITFPDDISKRRPKYSLAPIMFSVKNNNNYIFAQTQVNEYKERYNLYKNFIQEAIANENTPNDIFLNAIIGNDTTGILSGFTQSVYYDENNKIVDVSSEGTESVRSVSSVTTGIYGNLQKTVSANFDVSDITESPSTTARTIQSDYNFNTNSNGGKLYKQVKTVTEVEDPSTHVKKNVITYTWEEEDKASFNSVFNDVKSIDRIFTSDTNDANTFLINNVTNKHPEWYDEETIVATEYAVIFPTSSDVKTNGYTSVVRLLNDIMIKASGYIECEYVFPMFTIFDNGRGKSIKSISIEYDAATSVTLKKAIYNLNVYNYATGTKLEKFSFSLNPYTRNNNTGYTFDIESAVNYVSKQVSVKTYYNSYDALLETLMTILKTKDTSVIENTDILFGHDLSGKYPAFNTYQVSAYLKRNSYIYDYAHLDVFDNPDITVNAYCDSDNMSVLDDNSMVKYYYYNYIRQNKRIFENLEFGSDGYMLSRTQKSTETDIKVPFIIVDETDTLSGSRIDEIIYVAGYSNGAIISDGSADLTGSDITKVPVLETNFVKVTLNMYKVEHVDESGVVSDEKFYTIRNRKADSVIKPEDSTDKNCWRWSNDKNRRPVTVYVPITMDYLYQEQYRRFYNGDYDRDIFNLDVYFPNAIFDANYSNPTKLAIQRLVAYRGDLMCYMDMGIKKVLNYKDCFDRIPSMTGGIELTEDNNGYYYIRDMHVAVSCIDYKVRNPYDNKVIHVTGTYGLSNLYINHFRNDVSKVFAGISNNITINNIIEGTVNYIPKIYPTSEMTSLNNIGGVYPSDDETIVNEKQLMCDLKVNYGCYYDDRFSVETEYTLNGTESEFSYFNNVALVCVMMQAIRKACPSARYQFITTKDLNEYQAAVETAMRPWKNRFASLNFKYVQDDTAIENKIFYAAIEVVFKPFAQAEIFELTALNYSTLSTTITNN